MQEVLADSSTAGGVAVSSTETRQKRCELATVEALELDELLGKIEEVTETHEHDEPLLQSLRTSAALLRDRRNDRLNEAARLEAIEAGS